MAAHARKYKLVTSLLTVSMLTACGGDKDLSAEDTTVPLTGFTNSTLSVTEESATQNIKLPVSITEAYRQKWLKDNLDSNANTDFDLDITLESRYVTATEGDIAIHAVKFSGSIYDPYFTIPFTVYNDEELEENETVVLSIVANDSVGIAQGKSTQLEITILENGEAQSAKVSQTLQTVNPGDTASLTVDLNNVTTTSTSLPITFGGTANYGVDYSISDANINQETLTIPSGVKSYTLNLNIAKGSAVYSGKRIEFNLDDDASITVDSGVSYIYIYGNEALNDTGVTQNSDGSNAQSFSTVVPDYPNQDASYGLSVSSPATSGWKLKKVNSQGNEIASNITDTEVWRCTIDEVTGMVWATQGVSDKDSNSVADSLEVSITATDNDANTGFSQVVPDYHVKPSNLTDSSNLLLSNYRYSYYSEDIQTNGNVAGLKRRTLYKYTDLVPSEPEKYASKEVIQNAPSSEYCGNPHDVEGYSCTTESIVKYANDQGLCGYSKWRLPKLTEVVSVIDHKSGNGAFSRVFPNFTDGAILTQSTTPQATSAVFCASADGTVQQCAKNSPNHVRLVNKIGE